MTIQETLFTGIESGCDLIRSKCTIENSKLRNYAIKSLASTMKVCTNVKSTLTGPQNQQSATTRLLVMSPNLSALVIKHTINV